MNNILIVYGTRPEYIKVKPLIESFTKHGIPFKTLFTGQHKDIVNDDADIVIDMSDKCENRLNSILINCLELNHLDEFSHILVQGDTTTVLGLAMNAMNKGIKIIHLEAGLRTYDFKNPFPEEYNRQLVSRIADIHLCPTTKNISNLENEYVGGIKFLSGNTVLDNLINLKDKCEYTNKVLVTLHRRENHDNIEGWFAEINQLAKSHPELEFVLPIHPNPNVKKHAKILSNVNVIEPLKHSELLDLLITTRLVITDSGGLQEECSFFNKKCIVCRKITERPESVGTTSFLVDTPDDLTNEFNKHVDDYVVNFDCPYGDGKSADRITEFLKRKINVKED